MEIRIDKKSEIPLRHQLTEQIIFWIATERLKPGDVLPSVRELSRRLKIHRNTVSQAYRDLKRRAWLAGLRGGRVVVRTRGEQAPRIDLCDLDDLINATIKAARERGYSLRTLRERVKERLQAQAPDRVLVVEQDAALRRLLHQEIRSELNRPVEGCALVDLAEDPGLASGALTAAPQYAIGELDALLPKTAPAIPLAFSEAGEQLELLRKLAQPSVIAVVSVSEVLLKAARSLLAPALGQRHILREFRFPLEDPAVLKAVDLVFADSIVHQQLKHPKMVHYRLIRPSSLEYLVNAMNSYEEA
jgi:DNA-binding transcriptional regulator YhcF (GntR family)